MKSLPEGNLICAKNGKRYKWYLSNGSKPIYLPKSEYHLAEQLAEKKYFEFRKEDLQKELNAIEIYLKYCKKVKDKSKKLLVQSGGYRDLLSNHFKTKSEELWIWQNEEYQRNDSYLDSLKHRTSSGGLVRSKSEVLIDSELYRNNIPYRYECALCLGNKVIYPDFTIRHPISGKTYYWEHFGAMDDPNYYRNVLSKLELYITHGIVPNINLITTYETSENPLGIDEINNIIERYFL